MGAGNGPEPDPAAEIEAMRGELLAWLGSLEQELAGGDDPGADVALLTLAHADVVLDEDELHGALRRAVLLRATGGDPYRDIDIDERAVTGLAEDIDDPARRAELLAALAEVAELVAGLPLLAGRAAALIADPERAWLLFALVVLVQHLHADA